MKLEIKKTKKTIPKEIDKPPITPEEAYELPIFEELEEGLEEGIFVVPSEEGLFKDKTLIKEAKYLIKEIKLSSLGDMSVWTIKVHNPDVEIRNPYVASYFKIP